MTTLRPRQVFYLHYIYLPPRVVGERQDFALYTKQEECAERYAPAQTGLLHFVVIVGDRTARVEAVDWGSCDARAGGYWSSRMQGLGPVHARSGR